jgi:hypothetical protein
VVLAQGIADVAPPLVLAFAANGIGLLGSLMTSSNTASNILFASLQQSVAAAEGLSEASILAAQHAGGAIGNSISPANVVLGTGTAGIGGKEGDVLRKTLPWAMAAAVITGAGTLLFLLRGGDERAVPAPPYACPSPSGLPGSLPIRPMMGEPATPWTTMETRTTNPTSAQSICASAKVSRFNA